jgi:hypothetical protein
MIVQEGQNSEMSVQEVNEQRNECSSGTKDEMSAQLVNDSELLSSVPPAKRVFKW